MGLLSTCPANLIYAAHGTLYRWNELAKSTKIIYEGLIFADLRNGYSFRDEGSFIHMLDPDGDIIGALYRSGGVPEEVSMCE